MLEERMGCRVMVRYSVPFRKPATPQYLESREFRILDHLL